MLLMTVSYCSESKFDHLILFASFHARRWPPRSWADNSLRSTPHIVDPDKQKSYGYK